MNDSSTMPLDAVLSQLRHETQLLSAAAIYRLSALPSEDLETLSQEWHDLPVERRRALLMRLTETSETNFDLDFRTIAEMALDDEDDEVRCQAIACLWEVKAPSLMHRLATILTDDPSPAVREAAASALGRFVLLGELGKLPADLTAPVEDALLEIYRTVTEPLDIRRRALESLAYSGREEVRGLIEDAYYHDEPRMRASAVFAMGRSADNHWAPYVLDELQSDEAAMLYEAAQAAGELELYNALSTLIALLESNDIELRSVAIWSLGEIGGPEARRALSEAAHQPYNESLLDNIEDALSMAALAEGVLGLVNLFEDDEGLE